MFQHLQPLCKILLWLFPPVRLSHAGPDSQAPPCTYSGFWVPVIGASRAVPQILTAAQAGSRNVFLSNTCLLGWLFTLEWRLAVEYRAAAPGSPAFPVVGLLS